MLAFNAAIAWAQRFRVGNAANAMTVEVENGLDGRHPAVHALAFRRKKPGMDGLPMMTQGDLITPATTIDYSFVLTRRRGDLLVSFALTSRPRSRFARGGMDGP